MRIFIEDANNSDLIIKKGYNFIMCNQNNFYDLLCESYFIGENIKDFDAVSDLFNCGCRMALEKLNYSNAEIDSFLMR